jgi:hypothetical protein
MEERKYLTIINRIENLIKDIDKSIDNFLNINTNDEILTNRKSIQIMKQHFESLYKLQFEKTEFLILLERLRSYTNEIKPHLVTNCEVIGELQCYKTVLENEIFIGTMPSTTNMIYNFCGLWEIEVKKGIYKFICNLLK